MQKIQYWRLSPVYEPDPTKGPYMATAALVQCMATGETLDTMGGGGKFLSNYIVDALDMSQHDYKPRVIGDADDFRDLLEIAQALAQADPLDPAVAELSLRAAKVVSGIVQKEPDETPDHTPG